MSVVKTIAIIPVRGGSKSIPLKNIKKMCNRPLVYWTIDAAVNCKYIDEVYISTDSAEIIKAINQYDQDTFNKLLIFNRSEEGATDTASTEYAMLELSEKIQSDTIVLLQATSPLTTAQHLNEAFELYKKEDFDSLLSVVNQKRFIWKKEGNSVGQAVNYIPFERPRRQDFDGYYVENGAFYITQTSRLNETKCRISGEIGLYEMPEETYFEIDEPSDWEVVEILLRNKKALEKSNVDIKLFATDCDGVLTDAGMYYSAEGDVMKKFNTKDGMGFALLREQGIIPAILTGENSKIVTKRAEKLQISEVFLGCKDKVKAMEQLLLKYNLKYENVAYIGDDLNDLALLEKVGMSFAVRDAVPEVIKSVDYVTTRCGGDGAVREAIDFLLREEV